MRLAVLLATATTVSAAALADTKPRSIRVGSPAPDFRLKLIDDSQVTLADLRGQVIVLNFWATWCVPCRTELPLLDGFYRKTSKYGLRVFAITTEDSVPIYRLKPLFAALAIPSVKAVKGPYGERGAVPYNIVIDRAGKVRYAKAGAFDLDGLNTTLIPLLREAAPDAD